MSFCEGCYTSLFAVIILVNVGCGVCVSTTAAFFHDGGNVWAILIFGLYSLFAVWMITFIVKEVFFNKNVSASLNWICGMSSVVTIGVIVVLYILVKPKDNAAILLAILAAIMNLFALTCVGCSYTNFLRFGLDGRRQPRERPHRDEESAFPTSGGSKAGGRDNEGMTLEQSLAKMVNHVENNPTQKSYKMYAAGSETPFEIVM